MNIKQLEVFVAIAETGSFSKGAERACLTQSTASQHIAALEGECGVRLFDRTGRGAIPTEGGKVLLKHAMGVLAAIRGTEQAMQGFCRAEEVALSLAASTIPGTYLVPAAVGRLRREHPTVVVTVATGDTAAMLALLSAGMAEAAVLGSPVSDRKIESEPIGHDRILLVAQAGYPLGELAPGDLAGIPLVQREVGSGTGSIVAESLRKVGVDPRIVRASAVLGSSEAVKQAVLSGCGPAFLSEVAVRGELATGILKEVPVPGLVIERAFTLAWRRGRTLSPAAKSFCRVLRQVAAGE